MDVGEDYIDDNMKFKRGANFAQWREKLPEGSSPIIRLFLLVMEEMEEDAVVTVDHVIGLCTDMAMDCGGVEEAIAMIMERRAKGEKVLELVEKVWDDD